MVPRFFFFHFLLTSIDFRSRIQVPDSSTSINYTQISSFPHQTCFLLLGPATLFSASSPARRFVRAKLLDCFVRKQPHRSLVRVATELLSSPYGLVRALERELGNTEWTLIRRSSAVALVQRARKRTIKWGAGFVANP